MDLERLADQAIRARHLDRNAALEIRRVIDRSPHLTAEEYEALRHLGRAVRAGEVRVEEPAA